MIVEQDLITFNIIINMILCLIIIIWDSYFYFKVNEKERWAKVLYVITAFAWLGRYVLYFLNFDGFSKEHINPPLLGLTTITLLSLAVGSIIRVQRTVGFEGLKKDIKNTLKRVYLWILKKS